MSILYYRHTVEKGVWERKMSKSNKPSGRAFRTLRAEREEEKGSLKDSMLKFVNVASTGEGSTVMPSSAAGWSSDAGPSSDVIIGETAAESSDAQPQPAPSMVQKIGVVPMKPDLDTSIVEGTTVVDVGLEDHSELGEPNIPQITDYLDPAEWPEVITDQIRDHIVLTGPAENVDISFPKDASERHFSAVHYKRKLVNAEVVIRRWLVYSMRNDCVFCFCCKLFSTCNVRSSLADGGNGDWKHLPQDLMQHENSPVHSLSSKKWVEAEMRLVTNRTIDGENQCGTSQRSQHWRKVLERLLAIVQYLAENNSTFSGSSDRLYTKNNGTFLGLVQMIGKFDLIMQEHLRKVISHEVTDHYCWKTIQNEMIILMAGHVKADIVNRAKSAKYFSVILDCTPDVCNLEQLSFTIRFVDTSTSIACIQEHFIGYETVVDNSGEGLTRFLLEQLESCNLDINDCRGQGYDNGTNMKGKVKGVQKHVLDLNSRAFFMPCGCHSLNLVVGDAARSTTASFTLFGALQRIFVLFSTSVARWSILTENVQGLTVKPLCDTRWECKIDCVKAVRFQMVSVHDALLQLSQESNADVSVRHEATTLSGQLENYEFIVSLVVWYEILFRVSGVSKSMQSKYLDLPSVVSLFESCYEFLVAYRENAFTETLTTATEIASELDVEPVFKATKRRRYKKCQLDYDGSVHEALHNPKDKFRAEFFNVLVDTAIISMQERFKQMKEHSTTWGFLYNIKGLHDRALLSKSCRDLEVVLTDGSDADVEAAALTDELLAIKDLILGDKPKPFDVLQFIQTGNLQHVFPNSWVAFRILLTIPVSVASGERSFSKLKLIKTYLRSTMGKERLLSLAILSIENDIANALDYSKLISDLASRKAREVHF